MAMGIHRYWRNRLPMAHRLAGHLRPAGAPRARFQTGAGSYSKRPAGAHGQDRLGQPLPAPANMGVCGRQVHDRSDLVALSVLGPRFSPQETRSEEHTSELQSLAYLVCRLLLEKKKKAYHL